MYSIFPLSLEYPPSFPGNTALSHHQTARTPCACLLVARPPPQWRILQAAEARRLLQRPPIHITCRESQVGKNLKWPKASDVSIRCKIPPCQIRGHLWESNNNQTRRRTTKSPKSTTLSRTLCLSRAHRHLRLLRLRFHNHHGVSAEVARLSLGRSAGMSRGLIRACLSAHTQTSGAPRGNGNTDSAKQLQNYTNSALASFADR